jgi:hypothetical protein
MPASASLTAATSGRVFHGTPLLACGMQVKASLPWKEPVAQLSRDVAIWPVVTYCVAPQFWSQTEQSGYRRTRGRAQLRRF